MKIVILVDYSNSEFNKDFKLSNMLIEREHNVFLAVNAEQFEYFKNKCDVSIKGYSWRGLIDNIDITLNNEEIDVVINKINNYLKLL